MKLIGQFYTKTGNVLKGSVSLDDPITDEVSEDDMKGHQDLLTRYEFIRIKKCLMEPERNPFIEFGNLFVKSSEVTGFTIDTKN